jgi:hypothetical protein
MTTKTLNLQYIFRLLGRQGRAIALLQFGIREFGMRELIYLAFSKILHVLAQILFRTH